MKGNYEYIQSEIKEMLASILSFSRPLPCFSYNITVWKLCFVYIRKNIIQQNHKLYLSLVFLFFLLFQKFISQT